MRWTCQSRETESQATVRVGRLGARPLSGWGDREPGHCQSGETGSQATVRVDWEEDVMHAIHELKAGKV